MNPVTTASTPWRVGARIVAFVDLILLLIDLFGLIVGAITSAGVTVVVNHVKDSETIDDSSMKVLDILSASVWILWAFVLVAAIIIGIMMWAALKLVGSSEVGVECNKALGKARIWRNVTIIFLILDIIGSIGLCIIITPGYFFVALFIFAWRTGVLLVVNSYMQELENMVTQNGDPNSIPERIIVK